MPPQRRSLGGDAAGSGAEARLVRRAFEGEAARPVDGVRCRGGPRGGAWGVEVDAERVAGSGAVLASASRACRRGVGAGPGRSEAVTGSSAGAGVVPSGGGVVGGLEKDEVRPAARGGRVRRRRRGPARRPWRRPARRGASPASMRRAWSFERGRPSRRDRGGDSRGGPGGGGRRARRRCPSRGRRRGAGRPRGRARRRGRRRRARGRDAAGPGVERVDEELRDRPGPARAGAGLDEAHVARGASGGCGARRGRSGRGPEGGRRTSRAGPGRRGRRGGGARRRGRGTPPGRADRCSS